MADKEVLKEGEWEFTFPNKDKYVGHYCAHISGIAWRQGTGVYTTHDGHIYESHWKDDKLNEAENVKITFPTEEQYCGRIHKYKYEGTGTYSFQNSSRLTSHFINNKPVGDIIYIDHFDELWYGKAESENVILSKEHIFSYELDGNRGKGKPKYEIKEKEEIETVESVSSEQEISDMKEKERIIFAKSFQTPSGVDFGESQWVKDFEKYDETKRNILKKITASGVASLTEKEKTWYKQYSNDLKKVHKRKQTKLKNVQPDLLRQYFDEKLKNSCPPVKVFYPKPYEVLEGEGESFEAYKMLAG